MTRFNGSCDCGAVNFNVELDDPAGAVLCHCDECKLRYGAFSVVYVVPESDLNFEEDWSIKTWSYPGDSGNPVPCGFCSNCGVNIYRKPAPLKGSYVLLASTLKDSFNREVARPSGEVFTKKKLHWVSTQVKNLDD
ncbi:Mss4-like protein [Lipomyces japonicus]|uniref:Mss4-like protein n=1 Tax=Lipomyces japonicus TaxID=56871 RepID=UPI0034CD66C9